jgi:hypothetical protein
MNEYGFANAVRMGNGISTSMNRIDRIAEQPLPDFPSQKSGKSPRLCEIILNPVDPAYPMLIISSAAVV